MATRSARLSLWLFSFAPIAVGCGQHAPSSDVELADASSPSAAPAAKGAVRGFAKDDAGRFVAFHLGSRFVTTVDAHGASVAPMDASAGWSLGLHATRIGRAGSMRALGDAVPRAGKDRVELARAAGVTEWFAAVGRGVEQGVDVAERLAGDGALVVEVASEGLTPTLARDGKSLELRDARGSAALSYAQLAVKDADGRAVAAAMRVENGAIEIEVRDQGARYPLEIDPLVSVSEGTLTASDGAASDAFGASVAISGPLAIVGASGKTVGANSNQGVAYVFAQSGATWTQQAELVLPTGAMGDGFGSSVAISGTTAIVGAPGTGYRGAAYVYAQSGSTWTKKADLYGAVTGDRFGASVAISGAIALVGAYGKSSFKGVADVFVLTGTVWSLQTELVASDAAVGDVFGTAVALSGTTAIVGAPGKTSNKGAVYVYAQSGTAWAETKLVASDGAGGDAFGSSVALNGTRAIVGAPGCNALQGAVYFLTQSGSTWTPSPRLAASGGAANDLFGSSVALSGTTAIVGAPTNV